MAKSAAPLLLVAGGAALLLMSGKKKKSRKPSGGLDGASAPQADPGSTPPTDGGAGSDGYNPAPSNPTGTSIPGDGYSGPGYYALDGGNQVWVPDGDFPEPSWLPEYGEGSEFSGLFIDRQSKLYSLGYPTSSKYAADGIWGTNSVEMTKSFQADWNWFVRHLAQLNPSIEYKPPYTEISADGFWGPETDARINKAIGKIGGESPVYVEELGRSVESFRDMIEGLKGL
jgi:hypothetical protein